MLTVLGRNRNADSLSVSQKIYGVYQPICHVWTPVSSDPEVFTSSPTVIVFLSRNLSTYSERRDTGWVAVPISFAGNLEQTVSYVADPDGAESGIWIIGTPPSSSTFAATGPGAIALSLAVASGKLSAMTPHKYSVERGFELLGHGFDAFKMAELINFYTHDFKPAAGEEMQ